MFIDKVVDNWHYAPKKARFQNYVKPYYKGQNIALYYFATTALSSLDYIQRFINLSSTTKTFTAFVTQEHQNIKYPQLLYSENIIIDNTTFSDLLKSPCLPQVIVYNSKGYKIFEGHPASFELRGFIQRSPNDFKESQIATLLQQLIQLNCKQENLAHHAERKSRSVLIHLSPKKSSMVNISQYLSDLKQENCTPEKKRSKSVKIQNSYKYDSNAVNTYRGQINLPTNTVRNVFSTPKSGIKNFVTGEQQQSCQSIISEINTPKLKSFSVSKSTFKIQTPQKTIFGPPPGKPKFRRPGPGLGDDLQNLLNSVTPIRNNSKRFEMYDKDHVRRSKSTVQDLRKNMLNII
ncbi:hypothetical protein SS50377_26802 [Spironucleus salmonicida]|uniref:Uncharacterized protein n=1 Tax=Spironucleus salmonicida TaxID=348837 RepID=V6LXB6_9EUKA|nr:hypothetical protein SS50377_26802 [Spironucleus salmonicida]|eukprot:EST49272.1 Hypothetical protein SS50377_10493 [Spironucleus salmonicida]